MRRKLSRTLAYKDHEMKEGEGSSAYSLRVGAGGGSYTYLGRRSRCKSNSTGVQYVSLQIKIG